MPPEPLTAGPSRRAALAAWATRYYEQLRWGGVALVGLALAWASLGWEVAVLAAALLAIYEFGLNALTRPEPGDALVAEPGAEVAPAPSM